MDFDDCSHPLIFADFCAICGLEMKKQVKTFNVSHYSDTLRVTAEYSDLLSSQSRDRLDEQQKLVLLVDLDQTVLHASCSPIIQDFIDNNLLNEIVVDKERYDPNICESFLQNKKSFDQKILKIMKKLNRKCFLSKNKFNHTNGTKIHSLSDISSNADSFAKKNISNNFFRRKKFSTKNFKVSNFSYLWRDQSKDATKKIEILRGDEERKFRVNSSSICRKNLITKEVFNDCVLKEKQENLATGQSLKKNFPKGDLENSLHSKRLKINTCENYLPEFQSKITNNKIFEMKNDYKKIVDAQDIDTKPLDIQNTKFLEILSANVKFPALNEQKGHIGDRKSEKTSESHKSTHTIEKRDEKALSIQKNGYSKNFNVFCDLVKETLNKNFFDNSSTNHDLSSHDYTPSDIGICEIDSQKGSISCFHHVDPHEFKIIFKILQETSNKKSKFTILHNQKPTVFTFHINKVKYFIFLRPFIHKILELVNKYEMHVYTLGNYDYATHVLKIIDPFKKIFGDRIISRDQNNLSFNKSLDRVSSYHDNIVVIDDRIDVWDFVPNVIPVIPFQFFDSGDINSPDRLIQKGLSFIKQNESNLSDCNLTKPIDFSNNSKHDVSFFKNKNKIRENLTDSSACDQVNFKNPIYNENKPKNYLDQKTKNQDKSAVIESQISIPKSFGSENQQETPLVQNIHASNNSKRENGIIIDNTESSAFKTHIFPTMEEKLSTIHDTDNKYAELDDLRAENNTPDIQENTIICFSDQNQLQNKKSHNEFLPNKEVSSDIFEPLFKNNGVNNSLDNKLLENSNLISSSKATIISKNQKNRLVKNRKTRALFTQRKSIFKNKYDFHLVKIQNILLKTHQMYFNNKITVQKSLNSMREKIFKNTFFYIQESMRESDLIKLIKLCGGSVFDSSSCFCNQINNLNIFSMKKTISPKNHDYRNHSSKNSQVLDSITKSMFLSDSYQREFYRQKIVNFDGINNHENLKENTFSKDAQNAAILFKESSLTDKRFSDNDPLCDRIHIDDNNLTNLNSPIISEKCFSLPEEVFCNKEIDVNTGLILTHDVKKNIETDIDEYCNEPEALSDLGEKSIKKDNKNSYYPTDFYIQDTFNLTNNICDVINTHNESICFEKGMDLLNYSINKKKACSCTLKIFKLISYLQKYESKINASVKSLQTVSFSSITKNEDFFQVQNNKKSNHSIDYEKSNENTCSHNKINLDQNSEIKENDDFFNKIKHEYVAIKNLISKIFDGHDFFKINFILVSSNHMPSKILRQIQKYTNASIVGEMYITGCYYAMKKLKTI